MSVTVEDVLRLPSLSDAALLGGQAGLQRAVSTVSVLEYTEASESQDHYLSEMDYLSGELVITCFASIRDDVAAQCTTMQRLARIGEVGLILFYVGSIMPSVDPSLVALADSLDFPLICMPNRSPFPRYSEVISEVVEAIVRERMSKAYFQSDMLERISELPVHQRSMQTVLGLLSARVKVSLLLTDISGNILSCVYWPRNLAVDAEAFIAGYRRDGTFRLPNERLFARRDRIDTARGSRLQLFTLRHDEEVGEQDAEQIVEVVRHCLNMWSQNYGDHVLPELVSAILQDEPYKMRRIAEVFNIDVSSIHNMWVVSLDTQAEGGLAPVDGHKALTLARNELSPFCKIIVVDIHNNDVVAFMDNPVDCDMLPLAEALSASLDANGIPAVISVCLNLNDTAQVRRVYLQNLNALAAARRIYPDKKVFSQLEIGFADSCRLIVEQGQEAVDGYLAVLDNLATDDARAKNDFTKTLAVYLLDAASSTEACAQRMLVHPNTVKYRLNRIGERLSFSIGHLPETIALYTAVALRRMLHGPLR